MDELITYLSILDNFFIYSTIVLYVFSNAKEIIQYGFNGHSAARRRG